MKYACFYHETLHKIAPRHRCFTFIVLGKNFRCLGKYFNITYFQGFCYFGYILGNFGNSLNVDLFGQI